MPIIQCPIVDCDYVTDDVDASIAAALLIVHNSSHMAATRPAITKQKPPKINRPCISRDSSEETWNNFQSRWSMFKDSTDLTLQETVKQLFQCCDEELGDDILRGHPSAINDTEQVLLNTIKQLAVTPVAISVRRSELLSMKQDHGENARSFFARIYAKATTCAYSISCTSGTCTEVVDFTEVIVKDVLVTGLADGDIKKEVLGWAELDMRNVRDTVAFLEAKEMACDALTKQSAMAAISGYKEKSGYKHTTKSNTKTTCKECSVEIDKFSWSKKQGRMIECILCITCWKKANPRKKMGKDTSNRGKQ